MLIENWWQQNNSALELNRGAVSSHKYMCFSTALKHEGACRITTNNCLFFSYFLTLHRSSPGSSNAPANIPPHWYGGCGYLPSSCSASAAPCGLEKRWRTTGPVHGNENNTLPDGIHKTAWPMLCAVSQISAYCFVWQTLVYLLIPADCKHLRELAAQSIHFLAAEKCHCCWLQASMKRRPSAAHHANAFLTIGPLNLPTEQQNLFAFTMWTLRETLSYFFLSRHLMGHFLHPLVGLSFDFFNWK